MVSYGEIFLWIMGGFCSLLGLLLVIFSVSGVFGNFHLGSRGRQAAVKLFLVGGVLILIGLSLLQAGDAFGIKRRAKIREESRIREESEARQRAEQEAEDVKPVGDRMAIAAACSNARDEVFASMYLNQLTEQLSVNDSFKIMGESRAFVTVTFTRTTDNLHYKRSAEFINRKIIVGTESKYKAAFRKAGLKEPNVNVIFHDS